MKSALATILTSVIGGMLLLVLGSNYTRWSDSRSQVLSIDDPLSLLIINMEYKKAVANAPIGSVVHIVQVNNSGQDDLDKLSYEVQNPGSEKVISAGLLIPVEDAKAPTIVLRDGALQVKHALLRRGEGYKFWIVSSGVPQLRLTSDRKGLKMEEARSDASFLSPGEFSLIVAGCSLLFFVLGLVLCEWGNRTVLRKVGFDPKEIASAYAEEMKR